MSAVLCLTSLVLCLASLTASASHIKETLTLKKGWNGVYLESTPDVADCAKFFKGKPVTKVMAYDGKGLDGMPLIDENGRDVLQPPIYYYTWNAKAPDAGTLKSLAGGRCYLIYASDAVDKIEFTGVPHPPHVFWRKTDDSESLLNLVGVSCNANANVSAAAYFGEGPYDGGKVLAIGGTDQGKPTMGQLLGASPKVANGTAYSLSASRSGLWPGVISVGSDQLLIANGSGTLKVSNAGTAARKFRMTMRKSDVSTEEFPPLLRQLPRTGIEDPGYDNVVEGGSWDVEMPLNGTVELLFKPVSEKMDKSKTYAAVLEILDLGPSAMRVRVPVWVLDEKDESVDGLWVGAMALDKVSSYDGKKPPFPAAGIMSLNVIMHVSTNGTSRLLQRAIVAADPDGGTVACFDNEDFPYPWTVTYRMFTGMMSVDVPSVEEAGKRNFSKANELVFTWGVPERARDNPFRHAWHPDHDGLTADYTMKTPTGDDPANYGKSPVKPELWSVTNTLSFKLDGKYAPNADESVSGTVTWDVKGLVSTNTIRSTGAFTLRRVVKGVEMGK